MISRVLLTFVGTVEVLLDFNELLRIGDIDPEHLPAGITTAADLWEHVMDDETYEDASVKLRDYVEDCLASDGQVTIDFNDVDIVPKIPHIGG